MKKKRGEIKEGEAARRRRKAEEAKTSRLKPQPIPENKQKMLAAFDTYIKYVPDSPELADHQVPQGAHLLRVQPLRRGDAAVPDIADNHSNVGPRLLLGEPAVRLPRLQEEVRRARGGARPVLPDVRAEKDATVKAQCAIIKSTASAVSASS